MKIVKLTFEDTEGNKYKFYTTGEALLNIMQAEIFTSKFIDAKTGEEIIHKDRILNALKMYPTNPETPTNENI